MDTRTVTPDILVLRDNADRAVLIRGSQYATAIDIPRRRSGVAEVVDASRQLTSGGLRLAILTREPEDADIPVQKLKGTRIVRADREPDGDWSWDVVPTDLLRVPDVPVHLIRGAKTLYDDAGRAFHCQPCSGDTRSIAVLIDPEDVLVVADDLHPELPPLIGRCPVSETIERFESWRSAAPKVLVPASGIPIAGDQLLEVLGRSISYLRRLRERVWTDMAGARYPWERLIYTVECRQYWPAEVTSPQMVQRHRTNVRAIAENAWQHAIEQVVPMPLAAAA